MTPRMLTVWISAAMVVVLVVAWVLHRRADARPELPALSAFAQQVDLTPLDRIAVQQEGRLKSFASYASSMVHFVSGPHAINGNTDTFTYLDLMLRPEAYDDADAIFVKNKPIRSEIVAALHRSLDEELTTRRMDGTPGIDGGDVAVRGEFDQRMERFRRTGMISSAMLGDPHVTRLLDLMERDLIRTAKAVGLIRTALGVMHPAVLKENLRIVPPPGGGVDDPWLTVEAIASAPPSADQGSVDAVVGTFAELTEGWRQQDPQRVNRAVARLAALLPAVSPGHYPATARLGWESWYFKARNMTWVWVVYLLSVILLVMAFVYRWPAARWLGLGVFLAAFGLHTFALALRWYVSGRWPNANMFEAVTTSAWFGACLALLLEVFVRRSPMQNLFVLASGIASMIALMCVHFLPVYLNPNISNKMPVLHDVWLYIHTNVIIFSYCLIAMAAVSAVTYVLYRLGGGRADYVQAGGAGTLIQKGPSGKTQLAAEGSSAGQVLDGATMVLMELAFVMLWTGLVMGAIWADHSWGRPWGWDPKEVFALNTFIILALLVHVRLKVVDKGLWTALLAIAGCAVMLFNWIFINFVIVGLHSYA